MADRSVLVRLRADVSDFNRGMAQAAGRARQADRDFQAFNIKNQRDLTKVGQAGIVMGGALALGVGAALKSFADFDAQMSSVQAATGLTKAAMGDLRDAALEAGARTAFSATEAAQGIEALAKAGVSTEAILSGGLNGALDLAAAGGLAVADAADIAATALTQFSLSGDQVPHVADLLAAAAGKAQGEVSDMGMALKQAGLVASQTGLSIEETTAGLASFASAGLIGSDAGTSFKSMLQRLTPQSAEAEAKMRELGISAYDAQGNFVGLESFAGNLQTSLSGLTVEQRNSAMATIFGSDAVRAASVLYEQGAGGIAAWTAQVNDAGYAQEVAATKLDNLKGDIEAFGGSLETAFIKSGSASNGLSRAVVQQATDVVNAYSDMPPAAQAVTFGIAAVTAAAALAGGSFLVLAPRIVETRAAMTTLSTQMPRVTGAMRGLGAALGGLGGLAVALAVVDQIGSAVTPAADSLETATGRILGSLADVDAGFAALSNQRNDITGLTDALDLLADPGLINRIGDFGGELMSFGGSDGSKQRDAVIEQLGQMGTALAGLASGGQAKLAAEKFGEFADAAEGAGLSSKDLLDLMPQYRDQLQSVKNDASAAAQGQGEMASAVQDATGAVQGQVATLTDLQKAAQAASDAVLGLRGSTRTYEAAIDDASAAVAKNGKTLDVSSEKGRANGAALDAIASSAGDVLTKMVESDKPISAVTAKFGQQREALVRAAIGFGMTREAAGKYADSVLRIPDKKTTKIVLSGADAALSQVERIRAYMAGLTNKTVTVRVDQVLGATVQRGAFAGRVTEKADGGRIDGPGTGTSDSIPAWLSNGEHVWTAREVEAAGGHGAVERMRRAVRGFAAGGPVRARAFASGGRVSATDSRSLTSATRGLSDVERIRAVVQAWEAYNRQLEEAERRSLLVRDAAAAGRQLTGAKDIKARAEALERLNAATKTLADYDLAAARDRESAAVDRQVAALDRLANAQEAQKKALERLDGLLDEEADLRSRLVDGQRRHSEQVAGLQGQQVAREAEFYTASAAARRTYDSDQLAAQTAATDRMADAARAYSDEQARIAADQQQQLLQRRDALFAWADLAQVAERRWGNTAAQLIANARSQAEQFGAWMDELASARARGLSQEVIGSLGLDSGPQALGQLQRLNAATEQEIADLNAAVLDRTALAGRQVAAEQARGLADSSSAMRQAQVVYAAQVADVQSQQGAAAAKSLQEFTAATTALQEAYSGDQAKLIEQLALAQLEFTAQQQALVVELAQLGQDQGRSYSEAMAAGIASGIPGILAAAREAAQAMGGVVGGPGRAAAGAPPRGTAGSFLLNGQQVHVNAAGIIDTRGPLFGQYPSQVKTATFDSGGWLQPGYTLAYNGTGQAERVTTAAQSGGHSVTVNINAPVYGVADLQAAIRGAVTGQLSEQRTAAQIAGVRG